MPAWIASALAMLGFPLARRAVSAIRRRPATAAALGAGTAALGFGALADFGPFGDGGGEDRPRRRRRRRALTASDRADIAFIAGILGNAAGKNFAMIIAARST